jgi:CRP-like cAMP-binding protein
VPEPFNLDSIELPADSEIPALLKACPDIKSLRFSNDEFLIHGSDTAQDIFLLLRGHCLVEQPDAPRERTPGNELAVIQAEPDAPVFLGEMAYLDETVRSASVRSIMATHTLRLKPAHLDTIMDHFPGFTRVLCRQFARRLGEANTFIKRYQKNNTMDVEQRFLSPGEVLVEAGAPADNLFQLVDGILVEK